MRCRYHGKVIELVPADRGMRMGLANAVNCPLSQWGYPREHRPCGLENTVPSDAGAVQMEGRFGWSRAYTFGASWFVATIGLDKQFVDQIWFQTR